MVAQGITALSRVQFGVEAVAGGSTDPATTLWRGMGFLKNNAEVTFPPERIGLLGGSNRSYIARLGGEILLEDNATYELLCHVLNSSIKHVDPTTDAGSASIRTWAVQATDTDPISTTDLDTLVIEGGDNVGAEIMRYCFGREVTLSGKEGEGLAIAALYQGREIVPGSFTSGLAVPSVQDILFSTGAVYIDGSSDTIGTTQVSETINEMNLKMKTGWVGRGAKDGRKDHSFIKRVADEILLDMTFEHNANSIAEKAKWLAQTERAIRLRFLGDALSSTGGTYDTFALDINLYGKWSLFTPLTENDGDNMVTGSFRVGYSSIAAAKASFVIANESASLP